jgi:hypothetical protein
VSITVRWYAVDEVIGDVTPHVSQPLQHLALEGGDALLAWIWGENAIEHGLAPSQGHNAQEGHLGGGSEGDLLVQP